jgi:hypothetical protein
MPIELTGSRCARRGCERPEWAEGLCVRCRRLACLFGKDPRMFAHAPLAEYSDPHDTVALPWDDWERQAARRGLTLAELLAEGPADDDRGLSASSG